MSFKDIALPLAARGIPVIPVEPLSKETRLPGGEERGTRDTARIEAWDRENPAYNVGALGTADGIVVLDCDVRGLVGRIEKETGKRLPATFTVQSAGKGCAHLYFRQNDVSRRLGNKKGDGLFDLRGKNHYVCGPGSRLANGAEYKIFRDLPIADFPDWLEPWILQNSGLSKKNAITGEVDTDSYGRLRKAYLENLDPSQMFGLENLTIESLHPTLHSLACLLHDGQRTEDEVGDLLERISSEYGHREARGRHEIDGIVEHAFEKAPARLTLPDQHPAITPPQWRDGLKVFATEEAYREHCATSWRGLFHTYDEFVNVPPIRFAIEGFLPEESITMLGGLPGHGKTLVGLAMVRALLEGSPLFGHFNVPAPSKQVIYLIPECGHAPFKYRLQLFRLDKHIQSGRLAYRTLSKGEILSLSDPKVMEACRGADVFLDTAIRFISGDENASTDQKAFAQNLFDLLHAGARTVTGLHHSPKSTEKADYMSLENMLRGSGELGAALSACWGIKQLDKGRNRLFIQNVKDRDFQACEPFIVEGRPHLDLEGYFKMTDSPGVAGSLNENKPRRGGEPSGRPENPEKTQKMERIRELHATGRGSRDIAAEVGVSFKTVCRWLVEDGKKAESGE